MEYNSFGQYLKYTSTFTPTRPARDVYYCVAYAVSLCHPLVAGPYGEKQNTTVFTVTSTKMSFSNNGQCTLFTSMLHDKVSVHRSKYHS